MTAGSAISSRDALKPVRDRLTWITYGQLFLFAWFNYAVGSTNALLRDEQGVSRTLSGLHSTGLATAGIIAGLISARVVAHWGRGRILRLGSIGMAAGVLVYTWPGASLPLTITGVFIIGFFGALLIVSVNAFLLAHQSKAGPASLTEANALASIAGLVAPLLVGITAATFLGWRVGLLVIVAGVAAVEVWRGRSTTAYDVGQEHHAEHRNTALPKRVYWTFALIVCVLGCEFSTVFWSADLLRDQAGFAPAAAAASIVAVTSGMAIGRFFGSRLAQRIASERILRASMVITLIGFAIMWATSAGWCILLGLFVMGLGMSVHWPLGVARAVHASGGMNDRASALTSVWGSCSIALLPFVLGALADAVGIHGAFLLLPVLLILALVILILKPDTEHSIH